MAATVSALTSGGLDIGRVDDSVLVGAKIDKRCLHPGENIADPSEVDVAHERGAVLAGHVVLNQYRAFQHDHLGLVGEHPDEHLFAAAFGGNDDFVVGDPGRGCDSSIWVRAPLADCSLALAPWRLAVPTRCLLLAYSADFDLLAADEDGLTFFGDPFGPTPDYFRLFLAKPSHRLKLLTVCVAAPAQSSWRAIGGAVAAGG